MKQDTVGRIADSGDTPAIHQPPLVTNEQAATLLAALRDWAVPIIVRVATQSQPAVESSPPTS